MSFLSRSVRALAPFAFLAPLLAPVAAQAQGMATCTIQAIPGEDVPKYARPDDPWIFRGTDIPIDDEWLMGELPNGVRYAVRENGVPPCQASFRVAIDAGSLNEEDSERGFAHLLEHMTFRQSRDFGSGEAIPYFQRLGASLGADTNASTGPTQTVYKLDLPNADRAKLSDSVRLFAGMIEAPTLSSDNLAADLPIVLAEMRDGAGANRRIGEVTQSTFFAGQRLSQRNPIGTLESLQGATQESVRAFHQRWYRPENAVVVLVADADPQVLAALIEREFSDWKVPGKPAEAPDFGDPVAPANALPGADGVPVGEAAVIVEPGQARAVNYAIMRPWVQVTDNIEYNRGVLLKQLAAGIVNRRLENRARAGGQFLYAQVSRQKVARSVDGTYVSLAPLDEDWETALADVRSVIADALAEPPSQAEIDRVVADFDISFVNGVEQARIQAGSQLADTLVGAVEIREAVASPQTFLDVFRSMQDRFTPDQLLQATRSLFEGDVVRAVMLTPQAGEATAEQLREALAAPVAASDVARDDGSTIDFADLPAIGEPAPPVQRAELGVFDTEALAFENGVRAMLFSRDNEPGRVTVRVRFGAGWRGFNDDEAAYAQLGQMALINSGIGPLGQNDLDKLASGRKLGFQFRIDDGTFVFEGATRQEDLADQLYLFAAKLAMPSWDEAPLARARASMRLAYDSYAADPSGVLNRDLDWLLRDRDPRFATADADEIAAVTPEQFRAVWERLLAQGPVEVDVFGDIDREATVAALSRTFGALAPRPALAAEVANRPVSFPEANAEPLELTHGGDADQAAAVIAWPTGGGSAGLPESRKLDLLGRIYSIRLLDNLRERMGAAYSPIVNSTWPKDVDSGGMIFALVQIEPGQVPGFFEEAEAIARDLAANGPTADELARVVEPVKQYISRAQTGHTFWLNQLEGATFDPQRLLALNSLWSDYAEATPEEIRALAERYLVSHGGFKVAVMPATTAATAGR
ncbi:MAG: peptidase M16 [Sphingomonadales bacterium 32-64-17]|nr:MAG: peptidase M16 [Sphingomonadales bacterium 32-64-17]